MKNVTKAQVLFSTSKVLSIYCSGIHYMPVLNYCNLQGCTKLIESIYEINGPFYICHDASRCIKVSCRMETWFKHKHSKGLH